MRLDNLIDFIESRVPFTYYKNLFPKEGNDNCAYVVLNGGSPTTSLGVRRPLFQIVVRSKDTKAEDISNSLYESLTNVSEVMIGEYSIVEIRCINSVPLFLGEDQSGRLVYSINFEMTVRP